MFWTTTNMWPSLDRASKSWAYAFSILPEALNKIEHFVNYNLICLLSMWHTVGLFLVKLNAHFINFFQSVVTLSTPDVLSSPSARRERDPGNEWVCIACEKTRSHQRTCYDIRPDVTSKLKENAWVIDWMERIPGFFCHNPSFIKMTWAHGRVLVT